MNILVIHNTYQQPGGEDVVVEQETRLLERNGHKVSTYKRSNHEIDQLPFAGKIGMVGRMVAAADSKIAVRKLLHERKPDVVHVHNTFLMVSPAVYEVCRDEGVPVVQTVHNYRLLCPASTLYRNDGPCEECLTHSLLRSVKHGCYRDSRLMSASVAFMLQTHRLRETWHRQVDSYIAISNFVRDKYVQAGFPAAKISVKPNFVDPDPGERTEAGDYALFVGRLSPEKGLSTLLEAWERLPMAIPLVIAGDGPMRRELSDRVASRKIGCIRFAGRLNRDEVGDAIRKAAFVVVPSVWYEPFGLVVTEAFACGTPVLGARVGGIREMLDDQVSGLQFSPGDADDLAEKVSWAWSHKADLAEMGKAARLVYEKRYTANVNYELLMVIYDSTIDSYARVKPNRSLRAAA